jgi:hypothetical protein
MEKTAEWMKTLTADGSIAEDCMGTDVRRRLASLPRIGDNVCRYDVSKLMRTGWEIIGRMLAAEETDAVASANRI